MFPMVLTLWALLTNFFSFFHESIISVGKKWPLDSAKGSVFLPWKYANYLTPLTLQVTLAVPHPQGDPHPPMVGAVEAVAMTTMAAVPETAMAVVTVTRAVAPSPIRLAAGSAAWAGPRGARLPRSREATLLVTRTAAQVVGPPGGVEGAAPAPTVPPGWIEEWPAPDTEQNKDNQTQKHHAARVHCKAKCVEQKFGTGGGQSWPPLPCLILWNRSTCLSSVLPLVFSQV